ncbi:large ribosomal subunit protein bL36m [Musca vetustissima]|uniref:large ribosomal subunit protein bL36m n=1 Tax=Musca vetustissima TaxID=27455 RepID=UPI002AB6153B|nr:large ribosomal subunit protein bL36m [Musca vetustissima]
MSFVTKIFSSFAPQGLTRVLANTANCPQYTRSFHMMLKPLPVTPANISKTPTAQDAASPTSLIAGIQRLLNPVTTVLNQVAGFKVKGRLKRRCKDCYFVIRQQRHYVICPTHPRHKQMSMKKRDYKSWILTHATQSKVRPY